MVTERNRRLSFFGIAALFFAATTVVTIVWSADMSAMDGMPMPGGWTMSMTWMTGGNLFVAAVSFLAMWVVMMVAMMLPSLAPMLWRYRNALEAANSARLAWLTTIAGTGYFFVWTVFGAAIFPLAIALATAEMRLPALAHAVPLSIGVIVLVAGALQFTRWKARQLDCCRTTPRCAGIMPASTSTAWWQGIRFGLNCVQCCFGLMVILLVIGVMDLRAMSVVAAAITVERLAPAGERIARITGVAAIVAGLGLIVQAI